MLGRIVSEIGPGAGNPRNSEGAFLRLKDGRLLFAYSRYFSDSWGDDAPAAIAARISEDEGESWSPDRILFTPGQLGAENLMSVSLLRMADGDMGLFFLEKRPGEDGRVMRLLMARSSDEGLSWGRIRQIGPHQGNYVTNNDRVIRLSSGRLVAPANFHRIGLGEAFDSRGVGCFFLSDDDGASWREAKDCLFPPSNKFASGLQETGVVELKDRLWAYMRTSVGVQYESFSTDGGETFCDPMPSAFTGPCSPLHVKRLPDGRLFALYNPIPQYQTRRPGEGGFGGRTPYVAVLSSDEGKTWGKPLYLEDGSEDAGYCYPTLYPMEHCLLAAYCAGRPEDQSCLNRIRMRKISYDELK